MRSERPKFIRALFETLGREYDERGIIAIVPYGAAVSFGIGATFAYLISDSFWDHKDLAVSTTVYVGILTFNGLVLALSWNAFSRIHSSLLEGEISSFLLKKNLLNGYLLYIDYAHIAQMICVAASGFGLLFVLVQVNLIYERITLAVVVGLSVYATKKAANVVTAMHDLVYQKAIFEHHRRAASVTPIRPQGGSTA